MLYAIIILSLLVIILLIWKTESGQKVVGGICGAMSARSAKKAENKEKILEFLKEKGKVSNQELRDLFKVSNRTAATYLDELEAEGKVVQVGKTGKYTYYKLK